MKRATATALTIVAAATLGGCIDELESPAEIDGPRVLALRASPEGEPALASPAPGDTLALEWLAVDADAEAPALEWSFQACLLDPARIGADTCAAPPFAEVRGGAAAGEPARAALPVPAGLAPGDALLLRGVACTAGEPTLDGDGLPRGCTAGEEAATPWRFAIDVRAREDANRHPALVGATLDGEEWAAPIGRGCADGARRVDAGSTHDLAVGVTAGAHEMLEGATGEETAESLQVAHHATAGGFDAYFAFVDPGSLESAARWTAPDAGRVPEGGLPVGLWLVVLDGRGGAAWLARSVCVVP